MPVDPLEIDGGAQAIVAADVITAQERAVAGAAHRSGQAPIGIELELAVGEDIAAKIAFSDAIARQTGDAAAVGRIPRDLERALIGQLAVLPAHHGERFGEEICARGRIAIGAETPVITAADLKAVALRNAQIGHQEACDRPSIGADRKAGQRQETRTEQFEIGVAEPDPAVAGVVRHAIGGDAPARRLVAAFGRGDGAGGVGRAFELDRPVRAARSGFCGQPPALAQRQQQVLHRAGFEFVGQHHAVREQLIAVFVHEAHASFGEDFATVTVPGYAIGPHRAIAAAQDDAAAGSDGVAGRIVAERVGFEGDLFAVGALAGRQVDRVLRCIFQRARGEVGAFFLVLETVGIGPVGLILRGGHPGGRTVLREGGGAVKTGYQTDA